MRALIAMPWLGLIPAALFLAAHRVARRPVVMVAGVAWLAYVPYEYAMLRRWLCSGECNIRVDLLLVYPALVLISVAAAVAVLRSAARRRRQET
jgi:hypothetical protein